MPSSPPTDAECRNNERVKGNESGKGPFHGQLWCPWDIEMLIDAYRAQDYRPSLRKITRLRPPYHPRCTTHELAWEKGYHCPAVTSLHVQFASGLRFLPLVSILYIIKRRKH
ncbi:hypothetical protein SLEP1_g47254 [Rubroshorea leprosula]|uniref:Uncharacterized protein n=1 Tax=Rubroshorea leprosula TaxID=152421 RepID=A0AAV5LQ14_9ROSI|nr:hypothetical protein SLEP1_g47254 [Rubroshorea leprosula]